MRISDWSSDVCSSDLARQIAHLGAAQFTLDIDVLDVMRCRRFVVGAVVAAIAAREPQRGTRLGGEAPPGFNLQQRHRPDQRNPGRPAIDTSRAFALCRQMTPKSEPVDLDDRAIASTPLHTPRA